MKRSRLIGPLLAASAIGILLPNTSLATTETFDAITISESAFTDTSYTGVDGVQWTLEQVKKGTVDLDPPSLVMRGWGNGSISTTTSTTVTEISFDLQSRSSTTSTVVGLFVDNASEPLVTSTPVSRSTPATVTFDNLNIPSGSIVTLGVLSGKSTASLDNVVLPTDGGSGPGPSPNPVESITETFDNTGLAYNTKTTGNFGGVGSLTWNGANVQLKSYKHNPPCLLLDGYGRGRLATTLPHDLLSLSMDVTVGSGTGELLIKAGETVIAPSIAVTSGSVQTLDFSGLNIAAGTVLEFLTVAGSTHIFVDNITLGNAGGNPDPDPSPGETLEETFDNTGLAYNTKTTGNFGGVGSLTWNGTDVQLKGFKHNPPCLLLDGYGRGRLATTLPFTLASLSLDVTVGSGSGTLVIQAGSEVIDASASVSSGSPQTLVYDGLSIPAGTILEILTVSGSSHVFVDNVILSSGGGGPDPDPDPDPEPDPEPSGQPNIIFILADDLGPDGVGIYGAFDYEAVPLPNGQNKNTWTDPWGRSARNSLTPELDSLATAGVRFSRFHATAICSPSRAQYITGQYPFRCGVVDIDGSNYRSDPDKPDHALMLKQAGYTTGAVGKSAKEGSFDETLHMKVGNYWPNGIGNSPYGGDQLQDFVLDFIDRNYPRAANGYKPFYMYYSLLHPHAPILPTPDSLEFNGGAPAGETEAETAYRHYVDNVRYIDNVIGEIMNKLQSRGVLDNTIVIFAGDNGSLRTVNGAFVQSKLWDPASGDYRSIHGAKADRAENREGTSLVPCIVHWPEGIASAREGSVIDDLADFSDFLPTYAEVAEATIPTNWTIDGRSIAKAIKGQSYPKRQWVYTQIENNWCVRGPSFRLNRDGRFFDMRDSPFSMPEITNLNASQQNLRDTYQAVLDEFDPVNGPTYEAHQDKEWNNPAWQWKDTWFNSIERWETPTSGDYSDPDGDGVINLFERAFGWDPTNGTDQMPTPAVINNYLRVTYPKAVTAGNTEIIPEVRTLGNPWENGPDAVSITGTNPLTARDKTTHSSDRRMRLRAERLTEWPEP